MMKFSCKFTEKKTKKHPVYICWCYMQCNAGIKETVMLQQSIYSLKIDIFEYHESQVDIMPCFRPT